MLDKAGLLKKLQTALARREYSVAELKQKFLSMTEKQTFEEALAVLQTKGWQSDARFVAMLLRARAARGYGPCYIEQELKRHGISKTLFKEMLEQSEIDWQMALKKRYKKRYGQKVPQTLQERLKCEQYLFVHGFAKADMRDLQN